MSLHFEEFFGFFLIKGCPIKSETPSLFSHLLCAFAIDTTVFRINRSSTTAIFSRAASSIRTSRKVLCNHLNFLKLFHFLLDFHFAYSLKDFRHSPFSIILNFHIPCSPRRHKHHRWLLQGNQQHKSLKEGSLQSFELYETLSSL